MGTNRRKIILPFFILSIALLSLAAFSYYRFFDAYELEILDLRFALRPKIATTDKVALIEIGEDTIEKLGRFPFDRSCHAILIKALAEAGARAVVFDIFFSEPEEHDKELEEAMREAKNVYLPFVLDMDTKKNANVPYARGYTARTLENIAILARGQGHINIAPDSDGKFRRVPLYVRYQDGFYPYISFLMSCDYLGIPQKQVKMLPGRYLDLGEGLRIPLDEKSNMIINFSGRWGSVYKHYSYVDILQSYLAGVSGQKPILDMIIFKDKICIIGLTAAGTVDLHPNPFETLYPGVGIHAEVFNSILNKNFIERKSKEANLAVLAVIGIFITLVTFLTKPLRGLLILGLAIALFLTSAIAAFNLKGVWIDIFYPVLAMAFLYMSVTIYKYISEWKKRLVLENELDIAKKIQESFLPKTVPVLEGVDIASAMFTAKKVGGDLYDFVEFSPDRLGVMIGDVSGKGIPASLFMAMVTGRFKFFAAEKSQPKDVLFNLNAKLVQESSSNLFVTMLYAIFDMKNRRITFSNGGHLPILYASEKGTVEFLDVAEGAPLGLMENSYVERTVDFKTGDIFILYTDGVTEAMNPKSEMYESYRLAATVESKKDLSSKAILHAIEKDIRKFEPKASQHDDMTLMAIKITA